METQITTTVHIFHSILFVILALGYKYKVLVAITTNETEISIENINFYLFGALLGYCFYFNINNLI